MTISELGIEQFGQRRLRDPQATIDDLLAQTARQGKAIHDLNIENGQLRAALVIAGELTTARETAAKAEASLVKALAGITKPKPTLAGQEADGG